MSYFEKKRKYTEVFSKTEYLRGYREEKVTTQLGDDRTCICFAPFRLAIKRLISINFSSLRNVMPFNWTSFVRKWIWVTNRRCLGHRLTPLGNLVSPLVIYETLEQQHRLDKSTRSSQRRDSLRSFLFSLCLVYFALFFIQKVLFCSERKKIYNLYL